MSPELFDPEEFGLDECRPTKNSDRYALGMVIYEILSGRIPFSSSADCLVVAKVLKGKRPVRPRGTEGIWFTDDGWKIIDRCWKPNPCDRLSVEAVLHYLEEASRTWTPPQTVIFLPGIDPHAQISDSSAEECTEESEMPASHSVPPKWLRTPPSKGNLD